MTICTTPSGSERAIDSKLPSRPSSRPLTGLISVIGSSGTPSGGPGRHSDSSAQHDAYSAASPAAAAAVMSQSAASIMGLIIPKLELGMRGSSFDTLAHDP